MKLELEHVVPTIHAALLLDEEDASAGRSGKGARTYREDLTDGLVVAYAADDGHESRPLQEQEVAGLELAGEALRARTVESLRKRLRTVDRYGGPDVHMISAGGSYEASLLLADEFWNPETLRVDGDFVVAVPSHDVLMVTGSHCPVGIARLRQLARDNLEKGYHPITAELLVRRNGSWSVLPAWASSRAPPRWLDRLRERFGRRRRG